MRKTGKEQTGVAKALQASMLAIQVAQVIAATEVAAAQAAAVASTGGPAPFFATSGVIRAFGYANAALVAGLGAHNIATDGQAHEGFDYIPKTGSYFIEKGERVVKKEDNKKLTKALDSGMGSTIVINQNFSFSGLGPRETGQWIQSNARVFEALAVSGVNKALNAQGKQKI